MSVQDPHRGDRLPRAVGHWPTGETLAETPDGQVELQIVKTAAGPRLVIDTVPNPPSGGTESFLDEANVRALQGLLAAAWSRMNATEVPDG